jgi:hypothetical protein
MIPLDLEKIVLKALAKDPLERYATAGELAEDLGRFLEDRPVLARRPSLSNRAAKWARRHRPAVVSAALLFALLLIGLATAGWWSNATLREYNRRLTAEIDRADRHARAAEEQARKDRRNAAAAARRAGGLEPRQPRGESSWTSQDARGGLLFPRVAIPAAGADRGRIRSVRHPAVGMARPRQSSWPPRRSTTASSSVGRPASDTPGRPPAWRAGSSDGTLSAVPRQTPAAAPPAFLRMRLQRCPASLPGRIMPSLAGSGRRGLYTS